MSVQEIQDLKLLISATSLYYGHEVPDAVLKLYVEDLSDLPFDRVAWAIKEARRDPKTTRFPLPAIIRDKIQPADMSESECLIAAARIIGAVSTVGPYDLVRAKAFIGDLGWEIVKLEGGWEQVCQKLTYDNESTLKAQWRNTAKAVVQRMRAGLTNGPSLPAPEVKQIGLSSFGGLALIKSMPKGGA